MKILILLACFLYAFATESSSSSEEQTQSETGYNEPEPMRRHEFHAVHDQMKSYLFGAFLRNPDHIARMCGMLKKDQFKSRNNQIPTASDDNTVIVQNRAYWARHKVAVKRCCDQASTFGKQACFLSMQRAQYDSACQSTDNTNRHQCCDLEAHARDECFRNAGKPLNKFQTSGTQQSPVVQSSSSSRQSNMKMDFFATDGEAGELYKKVHSIFSRHPRPQNSDNGEDNGSDLESKCSESKAFCVEQCCWDGSDWGKCLKPGDCPYLKCRDFGRQYLRNHTDIQYKLPCEFVFILCCEKEYHKDLYSPRPIMENDEE